MPMHLNASKSNQIGLGFQIDSIDGQLFSLHSNFGLKDVNGGGLQLSSQLMGTANTNPDIGLHQNELISPRCQPTSSLGQLGLCQQVTEMSRTYVTPHRVRVRSVIDYDYISVQNQASLPKIEVIVTEIVRTQLLTATSTRDRIFIPNDEFHIQGQPSFQSQSLPMSNQMNHSSFTFQREPFHDHHFQNPSLNPSYNFNQLQNPSHDPSLGSYLQNQSYNPSHYQNQPSKRAKLCLIHHMETKDQNPSENQPPRNISLQNLQLYESNSNPWRDLNLVNTNISDGKDETEGDGRTHSLPCKKYGPYTCPKCKGVFNTSQSFAAHMGSHYKYESRAERRRRQAAKYRRKNLRLVQLGGGLTVVPESFNTTGKRKTRNVHKKAQMAVKVKEKDEAERQEQAPPPELAGEEGLIDVEIKEEPLELRD